MTREQYASFSVARLRAAAREQGLTHISALKKQELIDALMAYEEQKSGAGQEEKTEPRHEGMPAHRQAETTELTGQTEKKTHAGTVHEHTRTRQNARRSARQNGRPDNAQRNREPGSSAQKTGEQGTAVSETDEQRNDARRQSVPHGQTSEQRGEADQPPQMQRQMTAERSDRPSASLASLDSGECVEGILEIMPDGYGFIRSNGYLSGEHDVYVAHSQIRRFNLRTGDQVAGNTRIPNPPERYGALLYISAINGLKPSEGMRRRNFEQMTPIFPDHRIRLERSEKETAMRIVDLISPVGRGQRGMIVSPPKAGKTTLMKDIAKSILQNEPDMHIMIMLIDERPEEVTDIKEAIVGDNVEVLYSTFDELPEHHMKVAEMGIERARRLVEYGQHVTILLDSITRLARAYNLVVQPSGRTLSGGLDPAALNMPKRFFGAARNMREGGSLTILATALIDTGSKMDDVVYEEFKGTGNMELVLDRRLSERRVFPAIDIQKSGTRREDLLLDRRESEAVYYMRRALNGLKGDEAVENILNLFARTRTNEDLVRQVRFQKTV